MSYGRPRRPHSRRRESSPPDLLRGESGTWRQKWGHRLPVALVFPNTYAVATSNLGLQLVYDLLNEHPALLADSFVLPAAGQPPRSLESARPLTDFALVCYSLSFEGDTLNLLRLLVAGGLEPVAERRSGHHPLVIGGGVATWMNPEPLAPATDLFLLGEAEVLLPPVLERLLAYHRPPAVADPPPASAAARREGVLRELAATCPGCYVPRFYTPHYHEDGRLARVVAEPGLPRRIKPILLRRPSVAGYSRLLSPQAEFSDLFLVELGRGCSRSCRFCAAGFIYRPPRLWSAAAVTAALARRPPEVQRVGLLGMEMAAPDTLAAISRQISAADCQLSFASLRADALSPELLQLLARSRVKTVVLAPDGASERLRRVINKNLAEEDILRAAEQLSTIGVKTIKLYCMIGLPGEEEKDLRELVAMLGRLRQRLLAGGRRRGWLTELQLSVSSLVPKPWTPFQYHPFAGVSRLRRRLQWLRAELKAHANVTLRAEPPEHAYWQAIIARGDRRLGRALLALAVGGATGNPRRALAGQGLDPEWYACRGRNIDELLPWEIVAPGLKPGYLFAEYQKGLAGVATESCRVSRCRRCGICGREQGEEDA